MVVKQLTNFLKPKTYILILAILIVPAFLPLIRAGFFPMQDDLQAFRLEQMDKCFSDLQLPCRWIPDAGYQYGYPLFNFYAPGVYYLGEIFHTVGFQFIDSVKALFILGFVLSALAMYILVNEFFGPFPALTASVLYTYAPFKAVEVYVRGSLSEFWALVFPPIIFWSSYKFIKNQKAKYGLLFGASLAAFLLTHNLLPMIFLPIVGVWAAYWFYAEKKWRLVGKVIFFSLLGLGLAAFFILPVLFERRFVHVETLLSGYFDYRQHFVNLKQMFLSNNFGYGSSVLGPNDDLSLSSGLVLLTSGLVGGALALVNIKRKRKIVWLTILLLGLEMTVLFMMHLRSSFIWEKIWPLKWLQFPWRFLSDSIFILAFVSGATVYLSGKYKYVLGVVAILAVFFLHVGFFQPKSWINISDKVKFSGDSWEKQLTISIFDYLPIYAELPPNSKAPAYPEVLRGDVKFVSYEKGSDYQEGEIEVGKASLVRLPIFDFPGMTVYVDGRKRSHFRDCTNQNPCLGLVSLNLDPGDRFLKVELRNTPIRTVANSVSILSGIVVLGLVFRENERKNKNFG